MEEKFRENSMLIEKVSNLKYICNEYQSIIEVFNYFVVDLYKRMDLFL